MKVTREMIFKWADEMGLLLFANDRNAEDYARELGMHHVENCEWEDIATQYGWINPEFLDIEGYTQLGFERGLLTVQFNVYTYHDDNGHSGAVKWCTDAVCQSFNV